MLLRGDLKVVRSKLQVEKANTESLKQLKQLYIKINKGLDKLEEDYVPKSSFVLIKDNQVVAGSGYTIYKKDKINLNSLSYPVAISQEYIKLFLDDLLNHGNKFKDVDRFEIGDLNDSPYFNEINKYGKPDEEELYLNL